MSCFLTVDFLYGGPPDELPASFPVLFEAICLPWPSLTWVGFGWRLRFGKILCGKCGFSDEFGFLVRNLSVGVRIDEDFGVFVLGLGGTRILWFWGWGGWLLFLMGRLCLEWSLEMIWWRNCVIWWSFEWVMEVWRLKDERSCVVWKRRKKKENFGFGGLGVAHGRAATCTVRANSLDFCFCLLMVWYGPATTGTGRSKSLVY